MTTYELVKIVNTKDPAGFRLIRKDDFDPSVHVEFGKGEASASPAPTPSVRKSRKTAR